VRRHRPAFEFTIKALAYLFASAMLHTAYYCCSTGATGTATSRRLSPRPRDRPSAHGLVRVALLGERRASSPCVVRRSCRGSFLSRRETRKLREAVRLRGIAFALSRLHDRVYTVVDKQA